MSDQYHRVKQVNLNTFTNLATAALVGLVAYLGKYEFETIKASERDVATRLWNLEVSVREFVTHSEFKAGLDIRDQEILELKKEVETLRRQQRLASPQHQ